MNNIPKYVTRFYIQNIDLGQGSVMSIAKDTNVEEFKAYLTVLENNGYEFYTNNSIGKNLFATYHNDDVIVNVMYIDAFSETRVTVDSKKLFSLPGLESENVYEETSDCSLTLLSDEAVRWPGRMGYAYKLADGSFFLIDSGYTEVGPHGNSSADYLMAVLDKFADDPNNIKIAGWLITHIHEDHFGALLDMSRREDVLKRVTIEKLIYNEPCDQELLSHTKGKPALLDWAKLFDEAVEIWAPKQLVKAHPGQKFFVKNLKMTVYSSQDLILCAKNVLTDAYITTLPEHNDTSVVTKIDFMGKTALYLADSGICAHRDVLDPVYNTELKADILQVAHHGYGNTGGNYIYHYIEPTIVFWPVCRNHFWGQDVGYKERGMVYMGTKEVSFNKILFKPGIEHYVHEEECVTFSDFDTWKGVRWDAVP